MAMAPRQIWWWWWWGRGGLMPPPFRAWNLCQGLFIPAHAPPSCTPRSASARVIYLPQYQRGLGSFVCVLC